MFKRTLTDLFKPLLRKMYSHITSSFLKGIRFKRSCGAASQWGALQDNLALSTGLSIHFSTHPVYPFDFSLIIKISPLQCNNGV